MAVSCPAGGPSGVNAWPFPGAGGGPSVGAAHAGGQVVEGDEDGVDAGHGKDGVGGLEGLDVLALEHDEDLVVGAGVVLVGGGAEVEGVDAAADAAVAERRVA